MFLFSDFVRVLLTTGKWGSLLVKWRIAADSPNSINFYRYDTHERAPSELGPKKNCVYVEKKSNRHFTCDYNFIAAREIKKRTVETRILNEVFAQTQLNLCVSLTRGVNVKLKRTYAMIKIANRW